MVRPERSTGGNRTDERFDASQRRVFVVGIPSLRPKTRAFVAERTWAYQTKSAFSDAAFTAPRDFYNTAIPARQYVNAAGTEVR